jgi:uncharacterized protein DUF6782
MARRVPDFARTPASPEVAPKLGPQQPAAPDHIAGGLLALQSEVGNRAIAGLMARRRVVQRHPDMTSNEQVGEPTAQPGTATETAPPANASTEPGGGGGTGTTGTTSPALTGAARAKAITDALNASATGMWALGILTKWKIPVDWEYGGVGSFHQEGKIFLNKSLSIGGATLVMMHEAQHADTFKSGNAAKIKELGREEYVKKKIADEAEAVVRQIEGMAVTESLGLTMADAGVGATHKDRYLKAFNAKAQELRKANPAMSTADVNAQARTFARDTEVTNMFYDGTFITSTGITPTTYSQHYGKQWDAANTPPAK